MKTINKLTLVALLMAVAFSCRTETGQNENDPKDSTDIAKDDAVVTADNVVYSFAFVGCNRVGWSVHHRDNPSMANHVALDSIFKDMQRQDPKPNLFFNLGDIVRAEQPQVSVLNKELAAWVIDPKVVDFKNNSGIEMVAVPGNHELLQSINKGPEYPLPGSTAVWMSYMSQFMPSDRTVAPDADGLDNRSSFSFVRDSIAFLVLNTDTFNPPAKGEQYGKEGQFPQAWAIKTIEAFGADPAIKHIFAFGHRPYYVRGAIPPGDHSGLPDAEKFWDALTDNNVIAYLAAHKHDYQRFQMDDEETTQIIAGNGGSPLDGNASSSFFGYSRIDVYASGKIELVTRGYCAPSNYLDPPNGPMAERDRSDLSFNGNSNPLPSPYGVPCN